MMEKILDKKMLESKEAAYPVKTSLVKKRTTSTAIFAGYTMNSMDNEVTK